MRKYEIQSTPAIASGKFSTTEQVPTSNNREKMKSAFSIAMLDG